MQIDSKDYVIVANEKDKKILTKVTSVEPYKGVVCDNFQKTKDLAKYIEFEKDDVIANLGKSPKFGMAFGLQIEHIRLQFDDQDPWGDVKFFRKHNETEIKLINKALTRVAKLVDDSKIFPREKTIDVHIKDIKGPMSGMYHHTITKEGKTPTNDVIDVRIKDFGTIDYTLYHEIGHGVWFQLMNDKIRAKWIKAFVKNISLLEDLDAKIKKMRKELVEAETIKAYSSDLEDEDKAIFKCIIDNIKDNYSIRPMHINILLADGDDLVDIWPTDNIDIPQTTVLVTEYSTTDPEELFCESFAHYFDPSKQLPKSLTSLMEKTISICRYGSNTKGSKHDD